MIVVLEFMRVLVFGDVHLTVLRSKGSAEGVVEVRGGMRGRGPSVEWMYKYVHCAVGAPVAVGVEVGAYVSVVGA